MGLSPCSPMGTTPSPGPYSGTEESIGLEAVIVGLFAFTDFDLNGRPTAPTAASAAAAAEQQLVFPYLMDVQLLVICGIGVLYSFMQRFSWTGLSFTYLLSILCLEWAILCAGFANLMLASRSSSSSEDSAVAAGSSSGRIPLTYSSFLDAHGVAATILISLGATIGRISPVQKLLMVVVEATDPGGATSIHAFGAAFGLALAFVIGDEPVKAAAAAAAAGVAAAAEVADSGGGVPESVETGPKTTHDRGALAVVGTIILFCLWPSFNSAPLAGIPAAASRAAINTLLSLCGSATTAFAVSRALRGGRLLDMEHVANSTLAGGAMMAAAGDMITRPGVALACGCFAGFASAVGFTRAQPALRRAGLHDACGIFSLHFLPGVLGGLVSAVAALFILAPVWDDAVIALEFPGRAAGLSPREVAGRQVAATLVSVLMGAAAGATTGLLCRIGGSLTEPLGPSQFYRDDGLWHLPPAAEEKNCCCGRNAMTGAAGENKKDNAACCWAEEVDDGVEDAEMEMQPLFGGFGAACLGAAASRRR